MSRAFEEIDHQRTPLGGISLRRRLEPVLQVDVWEVKLGGLVSEPLHGR